MHIEAILIKAIEFNRGRSRRSSSSEADQGGRDEDRADQGDLEQGNLEQASTMIQVKGAVVAARDVPRALAAAYRRAGAVAELSALMGERRSSARTCFNMLTLSRFMKKWTVLDV
jgi:hypothetical protein